MPTSLLKGLNCRSNKIARRRSESDRMNWSAKAGSAFCHALGETGHGTRKLPSSRRWGRRPPRGMAMRIASLRLAPRTWVSRKQRATKSCTSGGRRRGAGVRSSGGHRPVVASGGLPAFEASMDHPVGGETFRRETLRGIARRPRRLAALTSPFGLL